MRSMGLPSSLKAVGTGFLWKYGHVKPAGRSLVRGLSSDDENTQTIAGIFLVRSGDRSIPLIRHAIAGGAAGDVLEDVLDDLEGGDETPLLEELALSDNPKVAEAALRALEELGDRPTASD